MGRVSSARGIVAALIVVVVVAGARLAGTVGQESQVNLNEADAMRLAFNEQMGKRVRVRLSSGEDIEGQVARVGTAAVALTQLTGQEFFNATINLEEVAAVIVRAPGK
jgi:hypothetical protein